MQPQAAFVASPATRFGHTCLGTLAGTLGGFLVRSVQKTEEKRVKATVFLTVASFIEKGGQTPCARLITLWTIDQKSIEHDGIPDGVASLDKEDATGARG